jgi:uroporphyrin-III C-methyltransferase / precorrin-2 dehydrogenase / sirohydrochlorin ferrochelatase
MDYLPLFVDLRQRRVLIVGGGETAVQKLRLLCKAGAAVTVIAERPLAEIAGLAETGEIILERRGFAAADVDGCAVVIGADPPSNEAVSLAARTANIPVNVVDRADLSNFLVPAIVDRSPIVVGISSSGTAPLLARLLRARLEALLPPRLGDLAGFAARFRTAVRGMIGDARSRRRFWESFFDSPAAEAVLAGDERAAREAMLPMLNRNAVRLEKGVVYLVGAGPGDPDLLTFQALRLMQQADVVLHDELIGPDILDRVRRDAERIYVGKTKGRHALPQEEINRLLEELAGTGKRVLRLKGGDPFVFGRGGEELDYLRRRGIDVIAAPGITAGLGCLAAAGIPLTHRDMASSVTFVTGQAKAGQADPDWTSLAQKDRTLVVYMGLSTAAGVAARLIAAGLSAETPVAIIQNGTLADQVVATGTLRELGRLAAPLVGQGPAQLVIGQVVTLAPAWSQSQPVKVRA